MNKKTLIYKFRNWLTSNSAIKLMHSNDFAEYEINRLLKTEAPGEKVFEDSNIFIGSYKYSYLINNSKSTDGKSHRFCFEAIGIGSKENINCNDYELADYTEHTYIINKK